MGMYSLLAASQPTVKSSEKSGIFCCAVTVEMGSTPTPHTSIARNMNRGMAFSSGSEISRFRLRDWKQFLMEENGVVVVFRADRLDQRVPHFVPGLHHVQGLIERIRIIDGDHGLKRFAVGRDAEAFDDMLLGRMRRA